MNLSTIFKRYLSGRETGQLVVKFAEVEHLCKVSIDSGQAVYITLGIMGPEETLTFIANKAPVQANFIIGVPPRKRLDTPLNDALLALAAHLPGAEAPVPALVKGKVSPQTVEEAIEHFIDIVGPLGKVIAENITTRISYTHGQEMDGENFSMLLMKLHDEVPEPQRKDFLGRHAR